MVAVPATPGVHVQRADPGQPRQVVLRTDIAGFAERGPVGEAVALESMAQFEAVFGGYLPGAELAYAVAWVQLSRGRAPSPQVLQLLQLVQRWLRRWVQNGRGCAVAASRLADDDVGGLITTLVSIRRVATTSEQRSVQAAVTTGWL